MVKEFGADEYWLEEIAYGINKRVFNMSRAYFYWNLNNFKEEDTAYRALIMHLARACKSTRLNQVADQVAEIFGVGRDAIISRLKGMQYDAAFKSKLYVADQCGLNHIELY